MKIISLGWGVQSFTMAAMVALGELEPVDYAIHADTTHESVLTYSFAKRWTGWLEDREVNIVTVKPERANPLDNGYGVHDVPFYSIDHHNGKRGQGKRQCTLEWKIIPMRRWIAAELKRRGLKKTPGIVQQWIGISLDEYRRMKDNDVKYIDNRWPLIEMKMTRASCIEWLTSHNLEVPPRSACTFCPFHSSKEWRQIKNTPEDWKEAVEVDLAIRKVRPSYDIFVHPARKPLDEIDFRTAEEKGQLSLWDQECEGICGI